MQFPSSREDKTSIQFIPHRPDTRVSQLCARAASVVFASRRPFVSRCTLRIRTSLVTISNTMSSTMSATAKTILKGPTDWIQWLEMVKSTATTGQVWVYVDPSKTDAQLPPLNEPVWPEPSSLNRSQDEIDSGTLTAAQTYRRHSTPTAHRSISSTPEIAKEQGS